MLGAIIIAYSESLPLLVAPASGVTPLKISLEYVISFLHIGTIFIIVEWYRKVRAAWQLTLVLALVLITLGELVFTLYKHVYAIENFIGHVYKAAGYFYLLKGLFVPHITEPFVRERTAVAKLNETEELLREAFDLAGIGMAIVSLDGRWLKVNQALCAMLGFSEDKLTTMRFRI